MKQCGLLLCLVVFIFAAGCSDKVRLGGTVTFSDDGAPVTKGCVVFVTATFQSRGLIASDGTYTLSSTGNKDGIPPGEYRIFLTGIEDTIQIDRPDGSYDTRSVFLISEKYASPETSGLTCVVDGKTKRHDIQVDRMQRRR